MTNVQITDIEHNWNNGTVILMNCTVCQLREMWMHFFLGNVCTMIWTGD